MEKLSMKILSDETTTIDMTNPNNDVSKAEKKIKDRHKGENIRFIKVLTIVPVIANEGK